jgi:hypothetical protein
MTKVGELSSRLVGEQPDLRAAPVVVLAYSGSGVSLLHSLLSAFPGLACTAGTGIVPLCDQAMTAWQAADGRAGAGFSPLALSSVRAFSSVLITAILAREGGRRWCEFITAQPAAAATFARLYPQARFLTVHRRADAVVRAILDADRWGLSGPEFAPFVSAHPANTAAALASYWAARTAQQLEFEQAHPGTCHRLHAENLTVDPAGAMRDIGDFLALDAREMPPWSAQEERWSGQAEESGPGAGFPLDRLPAPLLARVNELHGSLGYPPLASEAP